MKLLRFYSYCMIFGAAIKEDLISYKARDVEDWLFVQLI